jgi:hypothetical protein
VDSKVKYSPHELPKRHPLNDYRELLKKYNTMMRCARGVKKKGRRIVAIRKKKQPAKEDRTYNFRNLLKTRGLDDVVGPEEPWYVDKSGYGRPSCRLPKLYNGDVSVFEENVLDPVACFREYKLFPVHTEQEKRDNIPHKRLPHALSRDKNQQKASRVWVLNNKSLNKPRLFLPPGEV